MFAENTTRRITENQESKAETTSHDHHSRQARCPMVELARRVLPLEQSVWKPALDILDELVHEVVVVLIVDALMAPSHVQRIVQAPPQAKAARTIAMMRSVFMLSPAANCAFDLDPILRVGMRTVTLRSTRMSLGVCWDG